MGGSTRVTGWIPPRRHPAALRSEPGNRTARSRQRGRPGRKPLRLSDRRKRPSPASSRSSPCVTTVVKAWEPSLGRSRQPPRSRSCRPAEEYGLGRVQKGV